MGKIGGWRLAISGWLLAIGHKSNLPTAKAQRPKS